MSNDFPTSTRVLQKKPSESAFKQQKLPAWQPILTAGTVLPTFFVIGIAFIPIGVGILYFSNGVKETVIDYTDCPSVDNSSLLCADVIEKDRSKPCKCRLNFTLDEDYPKHVYIYYGLTNFYQNHRRYVKSRDDVQLLGRLSDHPASDCEPFAFVVDKDTRKPIAPCGAIANSMFSDELSLTMAGTHWDVPVIKTGIAWPSDKQVKFQNPYPQNNLTKAFEGYVKPPNWTKEIWELDTDPNNNGFKNEDFIVWMRTAALPNFRKLYRRVNHDIDPFHDGLPKGDYLLYVNYSYPVKGFKGTKSLIISTTSILGAKNPFLGYAYITVGCLCLLVGIMFLIIHIKYGKSTAEVVNVTPTTSYQ